ncbi:MAG TPA: TolC family outer membrane protein, partial [Gammaproteobacteria bacterium]|nr:TolC family outer membrane protein [Gammaproteobacteria bacterium]
VCAFCAPAMAQESLLDIYQRALQNDPAIREAEATYRAQAETKPQTRALLLPALNLSAQRNHRFSDNAGGAFDPVLGANVGQRSLSESDGHNWSISLSQTVFDWSLYAQLRQSDKRVTRAETDYEAAKQQLLIRVATAYFNVLSAEDNLASAVAAREAIARQLEQANRRFEVGLIAITDVQQSQAGFDTAVADEIDAQRSLATSQEQLREIIGVIVDELAGPTDNLPLLSPDPADAEEWVRMALSQNLALVSQRLATDIADDQIDIDRGNRLPTLSLSAGYSDSVTDAVTTVFGAQFPGGQNVRPSTQEPTGRNWSIDLRFPIFTGGANRSRIQQSVYLHRAATETLERIARQTERQTRDAYLGVTSAISRVGALRQAVESNRTALRATEAGFEVGTQTTVDVLNTQNLLRRAETEYSRSRYQYMLDILSLKQAAGNLTVTDLEQLDSWLQ